MLEFIGILAYINLPGIHLKLKRKLMSIQNLEPYEFEKFVLIARYQELKAANQKLIDKLEKYEELFVFYKEFVEHYENTISDFKNRTVPMKKIALASDTVDDELQSLIWNFWSDIRKEIRETGPIIKILKNLPYEEPAIVDEISKIDKSVEEFKADLFEYFSN